jgi:hypothetical protein
VRIFWERYGEGEPTIIVRVSAPGGFDWGDASIAPPALGLSMVALGSRGRIRSVGLCLSWVRAGYGKRKTQGPRVEVP